MANNSSGSKREETRESLHGSLVSQSEACKLMNCKASELIGLSGVQKHLKLEHQRARNIFREGRCFGVKIPIKGVPQGKWVTTKAECDKYTESKGHRSDGLVTVTIRLPYDKAVEYVSKNTALKAELRYKRKK